MEGFTSLVATAEIFDTPEGLLVKFSPDTPHTRGAFIAASIWRREAHNV